MNVTRHLSVTNCLVCEFVSLFSIKFMRLCKSSRHKMELNETKVKCYSLVFIELINS